MLEQRIHDTTVVVKLAVPQTTIDNEKKLVHVEVHCARDSISFVNQVQIHGMLHSLVYLGVVFCLTVNLADSFTCSVVSFNCDNMLSSTKR